MITIAIDIHKATLVASVIDGTGREVTARTFFNDAHGHPRWSQGLRRWHDPGAVSAAIESEDDMGLARID